jgi:hypothetical protein
MTESAPSTVTNDSSNSSSSSAARDKLTVSAGALAGEKFIINQKQVPKMEHNPQPPHQSQDATTTHNSHPVIAEPIK